MSDPTREAETSSVRTLMFLYGGAALLHFAHNGLYLREYPNLPAWLTSAGVYAAWCATTVIGVLGYWLYRRISRRAGLVTIALYAALGCAGLDHYAVAPITAHSTTMNATILLEVVCAMVLLGYVVRAWFLTSSATQAA